MATKKLFFLFSILLCMFETKTFAYDIAVENADGVAIYYDYINDGKELEVVSNFVDLYHDNVVIPEEAIYMNRTRKVTSIGKRAFCDCYGLFSVTIGNNVTSIGDAAFAGCSGLTSVTIPNSVTSIGYEAFLNCPSLTSVTIGNSVMNIGDHAFQSCSGLTSVTIGNSVAKIGDYAFQGCSGISSITIPNSVTSIGKSAFQDCLALTSVTIGNSVTNIGNKAFCDCYSLTSVTVGNSVTSIGAAAFAGCSGLISVTIPNSVTSIGYGAFNGCSGLTSVTIPNSVMSIGGAAFYARDIQKVISRIENPFGIDTNTFHDNTFYNATLYVPAGSVNKYKTTEGWRKFLYIEEGNGGGGNPPETQKCEKPTISYQNGKLKFYSATEDAICHSSITDTDIASYTTNEVQLGVTYNISVYATKSGYEDSEIVTATLCWIDLSPKTEGITDDIVNVPAHAVLIQNNGSTLTIQGADEGTMVSVYSINGTQAGSAISNSGQAMVNTNLQPGSIAIVKIGEKSVKLVIK